MSVLTSKNSGNYRFVLKERNALLWLVLLIFFVVLVVFFDSLKPTKINLAYLGDEAKDAKMTGTNVKIISELNKPEPPSVWKSFGDNFSSPVYLDSNQTDMYLDDVTTSLVFPPLYSWQKKEDCLDSGCDLTSSARPGNFLLEKEEVNYRADLRSMPTPWPVEVRNRNIVSASLYNLGEQQMASFVVDEGKEERGFVYFLNEGKYEVLISDETEAEILTKYGRGDGYIAIGGEENNFIIFYVGYEIHAFHYFNGELIDISNFFGLRVADDGFYPYIIKQGQGTDTTWYILSLEKDRQRLVKLWQNGTNYIKGSLDLSFQLNRYLDNSGGEPVYIRPGLNKGELEFILENAGNAENLESPEKSENASSLWTFLDEGFDNSKPRQAVSINLNKKSLAIIKAEIRSFNVFLDDTENQEKNNIFSSDKLEIYLGDSLDNFLPVNFGKPIKFNGDKYEFYWKVKFENSNKNDYSPWFDHINDLQYLVYL